MYVSVLYFINKMKTFHFSIYGNICEICESLEEKMINFSFYVSEMTEPSLILSKKLTILQACCCCNVSLFTMFYKHVQIQKL